MTGMAMGFDYDWTPQRDGSYSPEQMHRLLFDLRDEPRWRAQAVICEAYYDNDQHDAETLRLQRELGIPTVQVNMVSTAIDAIRGLELVARTDLLVKAEDRQSAEGAQALNARYASAARLTNFDHEVAESFADQVKVGIGWGEVSRNADVRKYPYRVGHVPWREMWPDWRSRKSDYSDARFIVRRRWLDGDVLASFFPKYRELIRMSARGWPADWLEAYEEYSTLRHHARGLSEAWQAAENFSLEEAEWRDPQRGRVSVFEVLYKVPGRVKVLRLPSGRAIDYQPNNVLHREAVRLGAELVDGPCENVRQAYYLGPHRLSDIQTATNEFHYIPFVGRRKRGDGTPYGYILPMISPQDAYNARHSRALYDTSARRTIIDEDAVDDHEETAAELGRIDAYITLRNERRRDDPIQVDRMTDMTAVTFQLMEEARNNFWDVTPLSREFAGVLSRSGQSGIAIGELIEQGTRGLGSTFENYEAAKLKCGWRLLKLMVEDLKSRNDVMVSVERDGRRTRDVVLNARQQDGSRTNDVQRLRTDLAFADAPNSRTYQQQELKALAEVAKSMPPEVQPAFADLIVEAAQIRRGREIVERIGKLTGFGPEPEDEEERQALAQQQQRQIEMQQRAEEIEMLEREASAKKVLAEAELTLAKVRKLIGPDTELTEAKTELDRARAADIERAADREDVDQQGRLIESGARMIELARKPAAGTPAKKAA